MNRVGLDCPADDVLSSFLQETDSSQLSPEVEAHIQSCETCQAQLEQMTVADDLSLAEAKLPNYLQCLVSSPPEQLESDTKVEPHELPELPGFELHEVLGHGGMGVVYRATHTSLNREVAVKVMAAGLHASATLRERLNREGRLVAKLQHPNFVRVFDMGEHQNLPFLVLELIEGGSLSDRKHQLNDPKQAARFVSVLSAALQTAHAQGIVHRDLKPANILLAPVSLDTPHDAGTAVEIGGETFVPKIADFGLSKELLVEGDASLSGAMLGTPGYMSPEQATENAESIGPPTDIHALGIILYELICGRRPFGGTKALNVLDRVRSAVPVSPREIAPKVPRALEAICLKCLEKSPAARYATAAQLTEDLRAFVGGRPLPHAKIVRRRRPWRRSVLVAMLLLAMAALGVISVRTNRGTVVIRTDDPSVEVTILRNDRSVENFEVKSNETSKSVFAGDVEIRLSSEVADKFRVLNSKFELSRGQTKIVTIERVAAAMPDVTDYEPLETSEPRKVAEWAIKHIGVVGIEGIKGWVDNLSKLPKDPLQLRSFRTRRQELLSDSDLAHLSRVPTLRSIGVAYQPAVTGEWLVELNRLPELRYLATYDCPITDANFQKFDNYENLQYLCLARTNVSSRFIVQLPRARGLRSLIVSDKQLISAKTADVLEQLKSVTHMDLYEGTDRGLEHLHRLSALRILNVYQSELVTQAGIDHIAKCESVKRLSFHDTDLAGIDLTLLRAMPNLKRLEFETCNLHSTVVQVLAEQLPDCDVLQSSERNVARWVTTLGGDVRTRDLGRRKTLRPMRYSDIGVLAIDLPPETTVTDADLTRFKQLQRLEELAITGCPLTGSGLEHITHLTTLKSVVLADSAVNDSGMKWIASLKGLEVLDLTGTKVTTNGLRMLGTSTSVRDLSLSRRQLLGSALPPTGLAAFRQLKTLSLTGVDDDLLAYLGETRLTSLTLRQSFGVTDASAGALSRLETLTSLDIAATNMTAASIDRLGNLRSLRSLTLSKAFSAADLERLAQSLPNCNIRRAP